MAHPKKTGIAERAAALCVPRQRPGVGAPGRWRSLAASSRMSCRIPPPAPERSVAGSAQVGL